MNTGQAHKKTVVIVSAVLLLLASSSLLYLLFPGFHKGAGTAGGYVAEIYQDGRLLYSIPLNTVSERQTLVVESTNGGKNKIEIYPDSIGIISADCPDKLCVRQGFITDERLPITCLPNRLVIMLRPAPDNANTDFVTPDIITY